MVAGLMMEGCYTLASHASSPPKMTFQVVELRRVSIVLSWQYAKICVVLSLILRMPRFVVNSSATFPFRGLRGTITVVSALRMFSAFKDVSKSFYFLKVS